MPTLPNVTIVMAVRNEGVFIRRSLGAVLAQDYPPELLQILIADGMSQDETRTIIQEYRSEHPNLTIIDNPGMIVSCGLNLAIRNAQGNTIIRVDGHTEIAQDYVSKCLETLAKSGADNVGGRMIPVASNKFGEAVSLATSTPFGIGNSKFHYVEQEEWVDSVYMGAWPKKAFERFGLFDEELVRNQDDEFNYRLRKMGGRIFLNPEIKSTYHVRSTPKSLWRQYFQYGFWKVRVLQKHPRQMSLRQFIPPLFVLALLAGALLGLFWQPGRWLLAAVAGAYLLANLGASAWQARRSGAQALLFLPPVFAILHLSYGLGFLGGLLRFAGRWGDRQGKTPPWPAI